MVIPEMIAFGIGFMASKLIITELGFNLSTYYCCSACIHIKVLSSEIWSNPS